MHLFKRKWWLKISWDNKIPGMCNQYGMDMMINGLIWFDLMENLQETIVSTEQKTWDSHIVSFTNLWDKYHGHLPRQWSIDERNQGFLRFYALLLSTSSLKKYLVIKHMSSATSLTTIYSPHNVLPGLFNCVLSSPFSLKCFSIPPPNVGTHRHRLHSGIWHSYGQWCLYRWSMMIYPIEYGG